jgi:hypothetical protein
MTPPALQRQAALAGAALLAVLLVVALDRPGGDTSTPAASAPPVSRQDWEDAVVWVTRPGSSACEQGSQDVSGVVHPVLPCGVKLVVAAHGTELRTEVVGRGPVAAGRDFALTPPLADRLGVEDGDRVRWRFAG